VGQTGGESFRMRGIGRGQGCTGTVPKVHQRLDAHVIDVGGDFRGSRGPVAPAARCRPPTRDVLGQTIEQVARAERRVLLGVEPEPLTPAQHEARLLELVAHAAARFWWRRPCPSVGGALLPPEDPAFLLGICRCAIIFTLCAS
jgi:hypothetical protein